MRGFVLWKGQGADWPLEDLVDTHKFIAPLLEAQLWGAA